MHHHKNHLLSCYASILMHTALLKHLRVAHPGNRHHLVSSQGSDPLRVDIQHTLQRYTQHRIFHPQYTLACSQVRMDPPDYSPMHQNRKQDYCIRGHIHHHHVWPTYNMEHTHP
jgi:hypothetical protein